MKILEDIHLIKIDYVNVYAIEREDKLILIDAGINGSSKFILPYIESIGYKPENITTIIITHKHGDHVGGLKEIIEKTKAKIAAFELEAMTIKSKIGLKKIDITLHDEEEIQGLKVIHTPGHTKGHICLLDKKTRALFIGDLVYEERGKLYEIPYHYSEDPDGNREAIKRLANVDFKHILPSHGKPILETGKEALLKLIGTFEH